MSKRGKIDINGIGGLSAAEKSPAPASPPAATASPPAATAPPPAATAQAESPAAAGGQAGPAYDPSPRRPKSERKNAFHFGSWLLEGVVGVAEELQHNDLGLPEEFWVHAYAARKEALLAVRALVDSALEQCDAEDLPRQKKAPNRPQKQRGQVDINFGGAGTGD